MAGGAAAGHGENGSDEPHDGGGERHAAGVPRGARVQYRHAVIPNHTTANSAEESLFPLGFFDADAPPVMRCTTPEPLKEVYKRVLENCLQHRWCKATSSCK